MSFLRSGPSRTRGRSCNVSPAACTERRGTCRPSLQTPKPAQRGRVWVGFVEVPSHDADPFRRSATSGARWSDGIGCFRFADVFGEIADQAAAFGCDMYCRRVSTA